MKLLIGSLSLLISLLPGFTAHAVETKDISFKMKHTDPVVFSHSVHLAKYNNNCRICHNALFNLKKSRHYTMAEMEQGKSCGACHTGAKAFSVASSKDCSRCHRGTPKTLTYKVKGATDGIFPHDQHVAKNLGCKSCHGQGVAGRTKRASMAEMEKGASCGSCHNGKQAFTVAGNCGNCHKGMTPREIVFPVKGVQDAAFSHKMHTGMYKCQECHTRLFAFKAGQKHYSMEQMEKGASCGACHNGKTAFASSGDCWKCHRGVKPTEITFKNDGGEVKFSHEIHLGMYKCKDCHQKFFPY
ncbi:MAG TPA: c(7)-type cytochrome triheme domain-containing protein, partial [Verrucomicrobiae bacterium]|nr:c(7)-type cytochrome triheme domain-containing protein [Verrucomicrobiae bacterium]